MKESEYLTSLAHEFWDTDQVLFARGLLPRDWLPVSELEECNEVKMWESVDFSACASNHVLFASDGSGRSRKTLQTLRQVAFGVATFDMHINNGSTSRTLGSHPNSQQSRWEDEHPIPTDAKYVTRGIAHRGDLVQGPNGDLWSILFQLIDERSGVTDFIKVKSHLEDAGPSVIKQNKVAFHHMLANSLADVVAEEAAKRLLPDLNLERKAKWAERVGVGVAKRLALVQADNLGQEKRSWRYLRTRPSGSGRSTMHADCFQHAGGRVGPPRPFTCTSQQRSAMQNLHPCVPRPNAAAVISHFQNKKRQLINTSAGNSCHVLDKQSGARNKTSSKHDLHCTSLGYRDIQCTHSHPEHYPLPVSLDLAHTHQCCDYSLSQAAEQSGESHHVLTKLHDYGMEGERRRTASFADTGGPRAPLRSNFDDPEGWDTSLSEEECSQQDVLQRMFPVAGRRTIMCGTSGCSGSCSLSAVENGYEAGKKPATCQTCGRIFPRPNSRNVSPVTSRRSRNTSPAMSRRSSVVSWSDSPRDQAVPKSVEAVMEDCTESHQTWNEMLGEQSRIKWEQHCQPLSAHLARSQPGVSRQCAHVGYPGVELVSRATYISRKKPNLETVQRQSKALKKAQRMRNANSLHNRRSAMKPLSLF